MPRIILSYLRISMTMVVITAARNTNPPNTPRAIMPPEILFISFCFDIEYEINFSKKYREQCMFSNFEYQKVFFMVQKTFFVGSEHQRFVFFIGKISFFTYTRKFVLFGIRYFLLFFLTKWLCVFCFRSTLCINKTKRFFSKWI
jgi:hypothetical protein